METPRLTLLGASSLAEALERYGERFTGARVRSSFAGSDRLAAQIRQGAKADVFASAEPEYAAELHSEGLVGAPVVFARNRLVVVVSPDSEIESLTDLARPAVKIAIGDPSVPVGEYAHQVIDRIPAPKRETILENVRCEEREASSVLAKVGGGADAGFVYATDARRATEGLRTVPIPAYLQPDVAYAAAVLTASDEPGLARRYLDGLLHGAGAAALREAGFLPP